MKKETKGKTLQYCNICRSRVCLECGMCWSRDCLECQIRFALMAIDIKKKYTPNMTDHAATNLAKSLDMILPKMKKMDRKIIEERRGDIKFLRQSHAFLAPYIRDLRNGNEKPYRNPRHRPKVVSGDAS